MRDGRHSRDRHPEHSRRTDSLARLDKAHRLVRSAGSHIQSIASEEGWQVRLRPARVLVLHHLDRATAFGLTPIRLAHLLGLKRSSLAHHLDALEDAGLVHRQRRSLGDGRRVSVRLTGEGIYVVRRLERALERALEAAPGSSP